MGDFDSVEILSFSGRYIAILSLLPPITALAFICEFVDAALGMGYGTTLTPLPLFLDHDPLYFDCNVEVL